jgi:hypothetical protein
MSEAEHDTILAGAFAGFVATAPTRSRLDTTNLRQRLRRRRQVQAAGVAVVAALAVATPVAANTAVTRRPVLPIIKVTRLITMDEVLETPLEVPAWGWGKEKCPLTGRQHVVQANPSAADSEAAQVVAVRFVWANLDNYPQTEAAVLLQCRVGRAVVTAQVIALDRDKSGAIVTVGQIIASTDAVRGIWDIAEHGRRGLYADVSDTISCCAIPKELEIHQQRAYGWDGQRFALIGEPAEFKQRADLTDLDVTASELALGPPMYGQREGAMSVTVHNRSARASTRFAVEFEVGGQSVVIASPEADTTCRFSALCHDGLAAGASVTFNVTVKTGELPSTAGVSGTARVLTYDDQAPLHVLLGDTNIDNDAASFGVRSG